MLFALKAPFGTLEAGRDAARRRGLGELVASQTLDDLEYHFAIGTGGRPVGRALSDEFGEFLAFSADGLEGVGLDGGENTGGRLAFRNGVQSVDALAGVRRVEDLSEAAAQAPLSLGGSVIGAGSAGGPALSAGRFDGKRLVEGEAVLAPLTLQRPVH